MRHGKHERAAKPVLSTMAMVVFVLLGILLFAGKFGLVGFRAFTVQSGSMEPAIERNSVVMTGPPTSPAVGDVITYRLPEEPEILVTHRIVALLQQDGETLYVTQGDANEDRDEDPVRLDHIVGEVRLKIPWIGAAIDFARTDFGFALVVIVPATILIYHEILKLREQFLARRTRSSHTVGVPR